MTAIYKRLCSVLLLVLLGSFRFQAQTVTTFSFTGSVQTFTVPPCVATLTMDVRGAQGGTAAGGATGGLGGVAVGVMTVNAGDVLYIYVGGQNGYNGGGSVTPSGCSSALGGMGGGGSDIRFNGTALSNRIIVGGGGGGGGGDRVLNCGRGTGGGGGGGYYGGGGGAGWGSSTVPTGGTQSTGGSGGSSSGSYPGGSGSLGTGGTGGGETTSSQLGSALGPNGGSGGGTSGNASTAGSTWTGHGGAGGSSYTGTLASTSTTAGLRSGNGIVTFTYISNGNGVVVSASSNSICSGTTVTLTASNVNSYTWIASGSFSSSNSPTVSITPTVSTIYTVTGTNSFGCISAASATIGVAPALPTLTVANTASATGGICPGRTVALTASGANTYTWTGGVQNGVTFTPVVASGYTVTGGNACGTSTAATSISVHPQPTVTASRSSASVCSTQSAAVTGGGASTYTWSPPSIQNGVTFYPFSTQTYTVVGTSVLGCTNSAQTSITVVTTPVIPPVVTPTLICIGSTATLGATGATNYSWTPFSPAMTTNTIAVSPTVSTTYTVTKWNANCFSTDSVRLIVNNLPVIFAITNPTIVCASTPATLQAGGGISYSWTPGNLPSGTGAASIVVLPAQNTIYTVSASDGTCIGTSTVAVATNPNPTISINTTTNAICFGESVSYSITGATSYTYSNNPPTSPPITATNGVVSPTTTTNYQVTGANQFGCTSSNSKLISVSALPPITITRSPTLVCVGYPSTLTASGVSNNTVHIFTWAQGGSGNKSVVNPVTTTVYTVNGTNTITSCQNSQTVSVTVFEPTFATTPDTAICKGGAITLTATGASSYTWTGGPTTANSVPFYNVSPTVATVYSVTAKSTTLTLQCYSSKTISVGIYFQPTVTATPSRTQAICNKESVTLYGHGAHTYAWPTTNQTGDSVVVTPTSQTKYRCIGTDVYGCKDTFDLLVKFSYCPGFAEYSNNLEISVFPNPNNGVFTIEAPFDLTLKLVNELGQFVKTIHVDSAKPGTINIKELPPGIYFLNGNHDGLPITKKLIVE